MLGMIRVRLDENAPRARIERLETMGGVSFQTAKLQMRSRNGLLDNLMARQSIRLLALRGVTRVATPDMPCIKEVLARYHMEQITHVHLMRKMAPQIIDHILRGAAEGAVLLVARDLDADVLAAAHHAARYCRTLVLDCGPRGEAVRRRLLDETGTAALLEQVKVNAPRTAVLLFDKPRPGFRIRMPRSVSVALCTAAAEVADFNDIRVAGQMYEPLDDTDREAVHSVLATRSVKHAQALQLLNLVKI